MDMTQDAAFLKEADTMKIEVEPVRGDDMQNFVREIMAFPENVKKRAAEFVE